MILTSIALHNYRSYSDTVFEIDPQLTLVVGPNAHGKTNLLEALHFVSTGKGINEDKKEDLIAFGETSMDVRIKCQTKNASVEYKGSIIETENGFTKSFFMDKTKKSLFAYTKDSLPVVLFSPSFMNIIEGSPSKRRRFVDTLLSRIDIEYKKRLRNYENAMRKRNKVIEQERDEAKLKEALVFWDDYLIEQAEYIVRKREWFANYTREHEKIAQHRFSLSYVKNEISRETLDESFVKQYYQRRTLVGPQRDDFRIMKSKNGDKIDVHIYSSRGEQRLALFWFILHRLNLYAEHLEYKPLLLLDDIFSELDHSNKEIIQELVKKYQTIITSAEDISTEVVQTDTVIKL